MSRPRSLLVVLLLIFAGCGASELTPAVFGPTPLQETNTMADNVLVNFRVERIEEFGSTEFRFNGSVKNMGATVENARFVVYSVNNLPNTTGYHARQIVGCQEYGQLLSQQVQQIAVTAVVPCVANVTVNGQFLHD